MSLRRKEIDGLRGIAVLAVVFYHAEFELFAGGYTGVDVFFTISGYVITKLIIDDLKSGKFSIFNFYERRARRILPALFFVIIVCIPFSVIWMLPSELQDFSESLISTVFFFSNILFWQEAGYFDTTIGLKPLSHTWSLALEEQFYILYPLLFFAIRKLTNRLIFILFGALAIFSLILSEYTLQIFPIATFYLLPTRAWEILIGSIGAIFLSDSGRNLINKNYRETLSLIGTLVILFPIFVFDQLTKFPGINALLPTIGTLLLILFVNDDSRINLVLRSKIFVFTGKISYSIYLIHQPIFAFAKIRANEELGKTTYFWLIIVVLILSYFSWRFIETPFRKK
jgi:peptidoglycan/LPS O-acetylase OafA/YrhL